VRFCAHVQTDLGAHTVSYTGTLPEIKRPERGVDHPPPSSAEVKERVELYLWAFVNFTFAFVEGYVSCPDIFLSLIVTSATGYD
jgi:hypothetical protein